MIWSTLSSYLGGFEEFKFQNTFIDILNSIVGNRIFYFYLHASSTVKRLSLLQI